MIQYKPDECRTIVNNCQDIDELEKVAEQFKFALDHNIVNRYHKRFVMSLIDKKLDTI